MRTLVTFPSLHNRAFILYLQLYRLPGAAMGDEFVTGQLYKPPLPPTYQEALEQSQLVVRLAVSKEPKIVEGVLTVVPNKRQLQPSPDNAVTQK